MLPIPCSLRGNLLTVFMTWQITFHTLGTSSVMLGGLATALILSLIGAGAEAYPRIHIFLAK